MSLDMSVKYLNIEGARQRLSSAGFGNITKRQMRRWAGENTLPFFKHGKSFYIDEQELLQSFRKKQVAASRSCK